MTTHTLESLKPRLRRARDIAELVLEEHATFLNGDTWVHEGDLALEGELEVKRGALLILGNLRVSDAVGTDESGKLVVTGRIDARHLYLEGDLRVHKDVALRGALFGFYAAGNSQVYGRATAKLGLIGDHEWECDDEHYEVSGRFSNFVELQEGDPDAIRRLMGEKEFAILAPMLGLSDEDTECDGYGMKLFLRV